MTKMITIFFLLVIVLGVKAQEKFELKKYEENGKYGLLNKKGKKLTIAKYDNIIPKFYDGLCRVQLNGKVGFINANGEEIIKPQYHDANDFSEGIAAVNYMGSWGYIDKTGKELLFHMYEYASDFNDGLALIAKHDLNTPLTLFYAFVNNKGEITTKFKFDKYPERLSNGFYIVNGALGIKHGVVNPAGKEIIETVTENQKISFKDGVFYVQRLGVIDELKFDMTGKRIN